MEKQAKGLRIALLQVNIVQDKVQNVENALTKIRQVVKEYKPKVVALPECFNCPYMPKYFAEYAEILPDGYTSQRMSAIAKELGIYLVAPIPELAGNTVYNTATVWSPTGTLIGKHRKVHLYDVDLPGRTSYKESDGFTPGDQLTIVNIEGRKVGIAICHDIRFEEMYRIYRNEGVELIIFPVAYDMVIGDLHYDLLHRSRANDTQSYVVAISGARNEKDEYVQWGHSLVVDPWGKITHKAKEGEDVVVADLDFTEVENVRQQIPIFRQRRTDLYNTERRK